MIVIENKNGFKRYSMIGITSTLSFFTKELIEILGGITRGLYSSSSLAFYYHLLYVNCISENELHDLYLLFGSH